MVITVSGGLVSEIRPVILNPLKLGMRNNDGKRVEVEVVYVVIQVFNNGLVQLGNEQ